MRALLDALVDHRLKAIAERWWQCRDGAVVPYWRHMPRAVLQPVMPAVLLARRAAKDGVEEGAFGQTFLEKAGIDAAQMQDVLSATLFDDVLDPVDIGQPTEPLRN